MTIVRKKRGITNNNKSTFQNGGSMKGSAPISAPKQDYSAGQLRRGATAAAKRLKTGAIGVAKVTGGIIAAPFALASAGIGLGVGAIRSAPKALLTTGKTALKSVKLGAQTYLAGRSRKKLREKLGVAYPESVTELANFAARKQAINNAHQKHMEHLSKHAPTLSTRTWYGKSKSSADITAEGEKKTKNFEKKTQRLGRLKDQKTERLLIELSDFHEKKALGGVTSYKTSRWGKSKRGDVIDENDKGVRVSYKPLRTNKVTPSNLSMDAYFADRLKQSQSNLSKSYEAGKKTAAKTAETFKQTDPKYKMLETASTNAKTKSTEAKIAYDAAKLDYDASVKNFTGTGPDYASQAKKIILNRYSDEYKAAEKKALESEQELQKATPKDISHYESKYYQRLQNVQNTKNSIKKNWTKFGQKFENKVRSSTMLSNSIYGKKKEKSTLSPTTSAIPLAGSDYGLRARLGLGEFGISPFTSKLEKSDKIEEVLFKNNQKPISQLTREISVLTSNIENLRKQIAAPIDPNAISPVDKNALTQELQKSQANLQTLSADKLTRQNLLSRAKITILKLKDEANYDKNINKLKTLKDSTKYSKLLVNISNNQTTNIIPELDTQIQILAKEYKRASVDKAVEVLRELQIMKQLKRYYNASLTQSKIDAELK